MEEIKTKNGNESSLMNAPEVQIIQNSKKAKKKKKKFKKKNVAI